VPKRGAFALGLTALGLALLLNFQAPGEVTTIEPAARSSSSAGAGSTSGSTATAGSGSSTSGSTSGSQATSAPASGATTASGSTVDTRYGPVQVSVTIQDGKLTDVTALQLPSGGRSGRISDEVEPMLRSQAPSAQSASIDGVSGATYTSSAYAQSLQAALDAAGFNG
jgi:uncharacterized protein with FMN-binding domain